MEPFLERVVGHLERVQRVEGRTVVDAEVELDLAHFEAFVFQTLGGEPIDGERPWTRWYLREFVAEVHWDLLDGIGRHWPVEQRTTFIEAAIACMSGENARALVPMLAPPQAQLLGAMLGPILRRIGYDARYDVLHDWNAAPRYCERLGLARTLATTPVGTLLLRLRGIDRLRWLLAVETLLATSALDPWCLDLGSVHQLVSLPGWSVTDLDESQMPANWSAIARWSRLGCVRLHNRHAPQYLEIEVTSVGLDVFGELAGNDATSFRTLARALLDDERDQVLAPLVPGGVQARATAVTLRHARMVAHEVRNALLPVQHALEKVWSNTATASEALAEPRRRIEEGLARLHRFVDDSLRLTPIAAEEAEPFSVMEAIEEARRRCDPPPGGGVLIEARPGSANPRCRGHRGRFVLALLNLLRNAVQVGGQGVRVEIGLDARMLGRVIISVSDDGPGISEAQQASIFENGVSYRAGGSGHGLSYVRVVVQEEMGGTIRVVSSAERRGACFELELPTQESEQ